MSIETFVVVPAADPDRLRDDPDVRHFGRDYVVFRMGDRYLEVEADPQQYGPEYASQLPKSLRAGFDPRGLLAIPEAGQAFPPTYAEVVAEGDALWLPVRRKRTRRGRRLLLVAMSPKREALLFEEPDIVEELLEARREQVIPGSLELGPSWITLQRVLFDTACREGRPSETAEALAPRKGMSYFENRTVEASRVVPRDRVHELAAWLSALPADTVARAARGEASPPSLEFPESLGACEADDDGPIRRPDTRRTPTESEVPDLEASLARLSELYSAAAREDKSVLSIRFRG